MDFPSYSFIREVRVLAFMLGCVKESTFVLYWPQFYEFDVSSGRNRLQWLHVT